MEADKSQAPTQSRLWIVLTGVGGVLNAVLLVVVTALLSPAGQRVAETVLVPLVDDATRPAPAADEAFEVKVAIHPGQDYALPEALTTQAEYGPLMAGELDDNRDLGAFAYAHDGAPTSTMVTKLIITALDRYPIDIVSIEVVDQVRREPLAGTHLVMTEGGQGGDDIPLEFDLDDPGAGFVDSEGGPYFDGNHTTVQSGERVFYDLTFATTEASYTWLLRVTYLDAENQERSVLVDRTGSLYEDADSAAAADPFALTAGVDTYSISFTRNWLTGAPGYSLSR